MLTRYQYGSDLCLEMRFWSDLHCTYQIHIQAVHCVEMSRAAQNRVIRWKFIALRHVVCSFHERDGTPGACGGTSWHSI